MKRLVVVLLTLGALLAFASSALASPLSKALSVDRPVSGVVRYAPQRVIPGERATKPYPSYTYYSELGGILKKIDRKSARVSVTVFGRSAGGRPLYLVTIQKPWKSPAAKARWMKFIRLQLTDPDAAARMLKQGGDLRVPVFINCSIHGGETTGVDAGLRLVRKLAFGTDSVTKKILKNDVVLVNACQNPDGRITDTRQNANGFDMNRDWITQSQPEIKAMVRQIVKWHPTMFLDLHGYYDPMVIDPTTNPHDPNYEWDLSFEYAMPAAESMEKAIEDNTIVEVDIPYRDWVNPDTGKSEGFEDYSPYYTPQFAMFYGLVGSTMETSYKSEDGVDAHYYGILQGATFSAEHRVGMLTNQIKRFQRAVRGESQPVKGDITDPLVYPYAYVIPVDSALQKDPTEARHAVRHLISNGIRVYKATRAFDLPAGTTTQRYPAGSYIVPLRQPLRGLANALLWKGEDISSQVTEMYDACAWQLPESWGFDRVQADTAFTAAKVRVTTVPTPATAGITGQGVDYVLPESSNDAVTCANELIANGVPVRRVTVEGTSGAYYAAAAPLGSFVVHATAPELRSYIGAVAKKCGLLFRAADLGDAQTEAVYRSGDDGSVAGPLRVGVYRDGPTNYALRQLGFDSEIVDADVDPYDYDVLVVDDITGLDLDAIRAWVAQGGCYIANGPYGIDTDLLQVTPRGGYDWDFYWANNVLGLTDYNDQSLVSAGLGESGYTFAFPITWFEGLDPLVVTDASYADDYFLAGFWRQPDPTGLVKSDAAGKAVIVHGWFDQGRVTFFGPMTAFRDHYEGTFRLLANAIYSWDSTVDRPLK